MKIKDFEKLFNDVKEEYKIDSDYDSNEADVDYLIIKVLEV